MCVHTQRHTHHADIHTQNKWMAILKNNLRKEEKKLRERYMNKCLTKRKKRRKKRRNRKRRRKRSKN